MARGINKVILIGNLGQDPDVRFTQNQKQVANVNLATSEQWTDQATGQRQEKTEWHRVVFFGRLAEIVGQYLKKGSKVYIEGRLQTRKWQNQQGIDQYTTEIVANDMQMLDSAGGGQQNYGNAGRAAPQPQAYAQPQGYGQPQQGYSQPQGYAQPAPQSGGQQPAPPPSQPGYSQPDYAQTNQQPPAQPQQPAQPQPGSQSQPQPNQAASDFGDIDDDIPF